MKFKFPIVIIDEDYQSVNASGLGIRALAQALEQEGSEVVGVTNYGDLSQFAQQQSRASAFILSIDDDELSADSGDESALNNLRNFINEIRFKNSDIPIYLYVARLVRRGIFPTTSCGNCTASFTCSKIRPSSLLGIFFAMLRPTPMDWHRHSFEPWSNTLRTALTLGTVPGTLAVLHF